MSARRRTAGALAALAGALALAAAARTPEGGRRIVAIGDVHGAYDPLVSILRQSGLVDGHGDWHGGDAVLVQTGDLVDRGARTRRVLELMIKLQDQAGEVGGEVVTLLGNHELMNLIGDRRDVTADIFEDFADERTEVRRTMLCRAVFEQRRQAARARRERPERVGRQARAACLAAHPPGEVEYAAAFGPEGRYGRWLRQQPVVALRGGVLFVHGGISPQLATWSVDELNRHVHQEIARYDRIRQRLLDAALVVETAGILELRAVARGLLEAPDPEHRADDPDLRSIADAAAWMINRPDGPVWFRGYSRWRDREGAELIAAVLAAQGAHHVVAGHTPEPGHRIRARFGGRVLLIDTGMLGAVYGGQPSALEIRDGRFKAIYLGREEILEVAVARRAMP